MMAVVCNGAIYRASRSLLILSIFLAILTSHHQSVVDASCNPSTQFTCDYQGTCIDIARRFDGVNDCVDNSDEVTGSCEKVNHFKCLGQGACLPIAYRSDGDSDCADSSDESKIIGQYCNNSWCCPCENFVANSFCNTATAQCACNNGYYANSINSVCIARQLNESCSTDTDCAALGAGACVNSLCACSTGSYENNGTCVLRIIGDSCSVDVDCSGAIANAGCPSGSCACNDGYYVTNNNTVCTPRVLGDNCTRDVDCSGAMEGSICDNGQCACHADWFDMANRTGCWHLLLGDNCTRDSLCSAGIANAFCDSGYCNCTAGWLWKAVDECRARQIGVDYCESTSNCGISYAQCVGGVCLCDSGYKTNAALTTCSQIVVGDPCTQDAYCASGYLGGYCDTTKGTCACSPGFLETTANVCRARSIGVDACATDIDCTGGVANSACVGGVCACNSGYRVSYTSDTVCVPKLLTTTRCLDSNITSSATTVASSSGSSWNCSEFAGSVCVNGYCACPVGYAAGAQNCTLHAIGSACTDDSQCESAVANSYCDSTAGTCQCQQGLLAAGTTTCRRRILGVDKCTGDSDCGIANSLCTTNNTCICGPGYESTDDYTFCLDSGASTSDCTDFASCKPWAIALIIVALLLPPIITGVVMLTYKNIQDRKNRLLKNKKEKYGRGDPYRDLGMAAIPTITNFTAPCDTALHNLPEIAGLVIRDKSFFRDITSITSKDELMSKVDI